VSSAVVFALNAAVGVALLGIGLRPSMILRARSRVVAAAGLPLLSAGLLSLYVFGEDSYRANGISRWDAYRSPGGALGAMFVLSVLLLVACSAVLGYASRRLHERTLSGAAVVAGLGSLLLVSATIIGFSSN